MHMHTQQIFREKVETRWWGAKRVRVTEDHAKCRKARKEKIRIWSFTVQSGPSLLLICRNRPSWSSFHNITTIHKLSVFFFASCYPLLFLFFSSYRFEFPTHPPLTPCKLFLFFILQAPASLPPPFSFFPFFHIFGRARRDLSDTQKKKKGKNFQHVS